MAIILKDSKTFTDGAGNIYSNSYAVLDMVENNKNASLAIGVIHIYKDESSRDAGRSSVANYKVIIRGNDWTTYMAVSALKPLNCNAYERFYTYLLTENPDVGLTWDDWESDE